MKRKRAEKTNTAKRRPTFLAQREDRYVFIRERQAHHRHAVIKLEKKFGPENFSAPAATRIGIDSSLLRELVQLKYVIFSGGHYSLNRDMLAHPEPFESEVSFLQATYAMFAGKFEPDPEELARISRACRETESELEKKRKADHWQVMHVTKRFRMPYELYLSLRPRMDNLSAYVRYLIYKDQGMETEAAMEKARMGEGTPEN